MWCLGGPPTCRMLKHFVPCISARGVAMVREEGRNSYVSVSDRHSNSECILWKFAPSAIVTIIVQIVVDMLFWIPEEGAWWSGQDTQAGSGYRGHRQEIQFGCCFEFVKTAQPLFWIISQTWKIGPQFRLLKMNGPFRQLIFFRVTEQRPKCTSVCRQLWWTWHCLEWFWPLREHAWGTRGNIHICIPCFT